MIALPLLLFIPNADARMESLPAFPQAKRLGPQRHVFGRIPVLPRASDVTQLCTANALAQSLVLPALERIGVKGAAVDDNHEDVLLKLFRNQKFSEFKSASVTDENVSRGSKHQQKGLSLGTVLYGGRACPEPTAMINAGYKHVKADAQGSRGWKSTHVPTYEVLDREVYTDISAPSTIVWAGRSRHAPPAMVHAEPDCDMFLAVYVLVDGSSGQKRVFHPRPNAVFVSCSICFSAEAATSDCCG